MEGGGVEGDAEIDVEDEDKVDVEDESEEAIEVAWEDTVDTHLERDKRIRKGIQTFQFTNSVQLSVQGNAQPNQLTLRIGQK